MNGRDTGFTADMVEFTVQDARAMSDQTEPVRFSLIG